MRSPHHHGFGSLRRAAVAKKPRSVDPVPAGRRFRCPVEIDEALRLPCSAPELETGRTVRKFPPLVDSSSHPFNDCTTGGTPLASCPGIASTRQGMEAVARGMGATEQPTTPAFNPFHLLPPRNDTPPWPVVRVLWVGPIQSKEGENEVQGKYENQERECSGGKIHQNQTRRIQDISKNVTVLFT